MLRSAKGELCVDQALGIDAQPSLRWRKRLARGREVLAVTEAASSFASIEELSVSIRKFIDYFNATMAKPLRWIFTGIPLRA